eukprot:GHVT01105143.1.p1 GENE.GHVT01105143.1~~GHVT01105143.1.p1  ORF type:complete len:167 (+),score=9.22 GHVT01105143.1:1650-2150(+)
MTYKSEGCSTDTHQDGVMIAHLSQALWSTTQRIGCAMEVCPTGYVFTACWYAPQGNVLQQPMFSEKTARQLNLFPFRENQQVVFQDEDGIYRKQYRKNDTNGETVRRVRLKDSKACHGMNLVDCRPPASAFDDVECTSENDIALQEKAMIPIVQTKRKLTRQRKNK